MLLDDAETFYQAQEVIRHYRTYYNKHRPHSVVCQVLCKRADRFTWRAC
jgi:hypothetical protein